MANTDTSEVAERHTTKNKSVEDDDEAWYAMRDMKRPNALEPAYKMLTKKGFDVFTPMKEIIVKLRNRKTIEKVPAIQDLLFVHSTRRKIDPVEAATPTLRYRFVKGGKYREATTVRDEDMEKFIAAVESTPSPKYYSIGEITPDKIGKRVKIYGGPLDGREFALLKLRGAKKKRIVVEVPDFIAAVVEVLDFDYMQIVG